MALTPFPNVLAARVIADDNDRCPIAQVTPDELLLLRHIRLFLYMQGQPTNEQIKVLIHTSSNTDRIYASSNTINFSDFELGANSLGWVRFDFDKVTLSQNFNYYLTLQTTNYTRDNDTFYLSALFDWPIITNLNGPSPVYTVEDYPKAFQLFALR